MLGGRAIIGLSEEAEETVSCVVTLICCEIRHRYNAGSGRNFGGPKPADM